MTKPVDAKSTIQSEHLSAQRHSALACWLLQVKNNPQQTEVFSVTVAESDKILEHATGDDISNQFGFEVQQGWLVSTPGMNCLFCGIAKHEVDSAIVFNDTISLAFLDHRPLFPGHCLLVPKTHYETLADLPEDLVGPFFENVQLLARAVQTALDAEGTFVAMNNRVSQSVPHLHVHIVPRRKGDGLKGFFWPRNKYRDQAELLRVQRAIEASITRIGKL